jgi:AcrR family transcriptional regulator
VSDARYVIIALPGAPEPGAEAIVVASPRGRMLDAMTASVAEKGYAATSVADVIRRAHASRKTFYEQFADKEDCFLAAYRLASGHVADRVAAASDESGPQLTVRLRAIYGAYLGQLTRFPLAARAFLVEIRAAGEPTQRHRRETQDRFAELLRLPGGEADPRLRTGLVAASEELIARAITDRGPEELAALTPLLVELAGRVLAPVREARR